MKLSGAHIQLFSSLEPQLYFTFGDTEGNSIHELANTIKLGLAGKVIAKDRNSGGNKLLNSLFGVMLVSGASLRG